jgi:hypothetical protein
MGIKNINVFEQHVEKIVLGLAAVGVLAMGYLAAQPVGFTDESSRKDPKPFIGPNDVEKVINDDIKALDEQRYKLEQQGRPRPDMPDFPRDYRQLSSGQPVESWVLGARFPEFGPRGLTPNAGTITVGPDMLCVIPDPPSPEFVRATLRSIAVAPQVVGPNGQAVPPPAGKVWDTETRNVVVVDGWIPVGQMVLQMAKVTDRDKRFSPDVQRGIVYRVHVQRQDVTAGRRTPWEDVPPSKGAPAPAESLSTTMPDGDLPNRITDIDSQFQWIQLPPYYVDAQGQPIQPPILSQPIPEKIAAETNQLRNDIDNERNRQAAGPGYRPLTVTPTPGTAPGDAKLPSTMEALRALEVQPFTFWDDAIKPDHTYQYRVQIQLVNPGFGWKYGLDPKQTAGKLDPVIPLTDSYVVAQESVVVHSDLAFFVIGKFGTGSGINGQIFKQENGRWYYTSFSALKGMNIAAPMTIGGQSQEVNTKFAVVDYQDDGENVHVILRDPSGNLVTRDSAADVHNREKDDLMERVRQGVAAAATSTAPADATTITPLPPTTGRSNPITPVPVNPPTSRRGPTPVPVRGN